MSKLDPTNFLKIFEMFGEQAAKDTFDDVASGKIKESTLEKYLYDDESKEEFEERFKREVQEELNR